MALRIPVLVPWRTDHGERETIWKWIRPLWDGWDVIEADSDHGKRFSRSQALNRAALAPWDLAVIADADTVIAPNRIKDAIALAGSTGRLVIAHSAWVQVMPDETDRFLATFELPNDPDRQVVRDGAGSMLVCPRTVWDAVGGHDERFDGWGHGDRAFAHACAVLTGGVERLDGPVFHLWHTRPAEDVLKAQHPDYVRTRDLWRTYKAATTPEQMRKVLAGR